MSGAPLESRDPRLWKSGNSPDGFEDGLHQRRMSQLRRKSIERNRHMADLAPSTRVMFLLKERTEPAALFTEMSELENNEWKETARWVKFEEDVEQGGNRWSKPHVSTLSLHSLFQLRSCLQTGLFLNDLTDADLDSILDTIVNRLVEENALPSEDSMKVREILGWKHTHQYEQASRANGKDGQGFLSAVRSVAEIGRSFSHGKNLGKTKEETTKAPSGPTLDLPKIDSLPSTDLHKDSSSSELKGNLHFLKKLAPGTEASNVLIGETNFLTRHICVLARLKTAIVFDDFTEVPVPTRFIFILLGPTGNGAQYREIGRAIATLMADEVFHDVAYEARNSDDLLDGVDEFLDQVTVLPPDEWDPSIRIEPPSKIPSQEKRKQQGQLMIDKFESSPVKFGDEKQPLKNAPPLPEKEPEEDEHGNDPALKRTGRLFGGLILDIKRKAPHYLSDYTDAFNMQCVATFCFMYFALLAPIVTFGGLLEEATHQRMAAMENLFGGAICGIIYHLFSGQPLTIIGSTGPVLVFETIVFDFCTRLQISYLAFRFWVHIWTALIIFIMCITDASALVSYITRFTEEAFATLIAVIFIYEAIMKLSKIASQLDIGVYNRSLPLTETPYCTCNPGNGSITKAIATINKYRYKGITHNDTWLDYTSVPLGKCRELQGVLEGNACYPLMDKMLMSILLTIGTFAIAISLKKVRNSCYFPSRVRQTISDFAVMIAIVIMTGLDMLVGVNTPKLFVPSTFRPTWEGRGWFISPLDGNPLWTVPLALLPALLACILIFMDQQITTVIVNRKENKLKKGCGYHLDMLVLSILIVIVGFLGLPIYVAATVLSLNHINSLKMESESKAPGEVAQFIGVREQRLTGTITFVFIGLSVFMAKVLGFIPMPVLYGVFLYMGIAALAGIQLFDRILLLFMPMKYQPDTIYIRHVPIKKIHLFTFFQVLCLALLWVVKSIKSTSILFPIMLVVMVAVRKIIERFFTKEDLKYLDDPMPDFHLRKKEDLKRRQSQAAESVKIEADDEGQTTIHAVKTEAHLHIPMNSGNVIKIPLSAIQEPSNNFNISKEVNNSGMWKHIASDSKTSLTKGHSPPQNAHQNRSPHLAQAEPDEDEAIMIKVIRPSPHSSSHDLSQAELQPLLKDSKDSKTRFT